MPKKKIISLGIAMIIIILFTMAFEKTYSKYVLTRNFEIDISSLPFYFDAKIENPTISVYKGEKPTLNLVIKNHDEFNNYNSYDVKYNISIVNNGEIYFDDETTRTISGNSKKDEQLKLEFEIKDMNNVPDNLVLRISTIEPYSKTIELDFNLQQVYKVTYTDFGADIDTSNFPQEIKKGETLNVDFKDCKKGILKVKKDGNKLPGIYFTYNEFEIPNVDGDIEIIYTIMTLEKVLREYDPDSNISKDLVGGMYRYQGTKNDTINNYICFGTSDKSECLQNPEKYMYRIIGITADGRLYLIKMDGVMDEEYKEFSWGAGAGDSDTWNQSLLFRRLNGTSNGDNHTSTGNSNIFIGNSHYDYMTVDNKWYDEIEEHNWMYGDVADITQETLNDKTVYGAKNDGTTLYKIETGKLPTLTYNLQGEKERYQWTESVTAKIGLMYLHDYYLAYDNTTNWVDSSLRDDNWIFTGNNTKEGWEWLLSRNGLLGGLYSAWAVNPLGYLEIRDLGYPFRIRPVFYLQSEQTIKSGTGTREDPFILSVQ